MENSVLPVIHPADEASDHQREVVADDEHAIEGGLHFPIHDTVVPDAAREAVDAGHVVDARTVVANNTMPSMLRAGMV